jgi:hypothetical protein
LPVDLPVDIPPDLLAAAREQLGEDQPNAEPSGSVMDRPWLWGVVAVGCVALVAVVILSFFIIKSRTQTRSIETV